jgi:probable F420-dependent oxidoreductase
MVKYVFNLPTRPPLNTAENILALVRAGDELGFDGMSTADHIAPPTMPEARYPYAQAGESGRPVWRDPSYVLESLCLLSFLAAASSKMRLITIVLVLPFRNPVLTAKMLATIDVLSKGRLTVGCGVGWEKWEFEALSTAPFAERGKVADEYIQFFREMWTNERPEFNGKYARFSDSTFLPKPIQKPHPPIWIGGESGPAMRRAARLGDGWLPVGISPTNPLDTPARYAAGVAKLRHMATDFGRDPSKIEMAYNVLWYDDREAQRTTSDERRVFTGTPRQIAEDITRMSEAGLQHVCFAISRPTVQETIDVLTRFANEVRPLVGR